MERATTIKDAQLVLIGGRSSIPNILTILHLRPDVVIALCSTESYPDFPKFKSVVEQVLPSCKVEDLPPVDAFALEDITSRCEEAFQRYPQANWICNITAATTIMSIAVYQQTIHFQQTCWYINTSRARVIKLAGHNCTENIFQISVPLYVASYYYLLQPGDMEERRDSCEQQWLPFAQMLGKHPLFASHLKQVLNAINHQSPKQGENRGYSLSDLPLEAQAIIKEAEKFGLATKVTSDTRLLKFTLNYIQYSFLNGGWLEVYVWNEAKARLLFDDCQWNHKVFISGTKREIDVALTYKAQLIIAECKTGDKDVSAKTLNEIVSLTNHLGGKFVGKILISSLFTPDNTDPKQREQAKGHLEFLAKADNQSTVVFMAEDLPHIGKLLEQEARNPKYPRI